MLRFFSVSGAEARRLEGCDTKETRRHRCDRRTQAFDYWRVRKTLRGPAPKNMRRNSAKRLERLLARKEIVSFSAAVKFMDFLFQVLSTRSACGPAGISRVTESPNMSSAMGSPSRETIIWRCWASSGALRLTVSVAGMGGGCAEEGKGSERARKLIGGGVAI